MKARTAILAAACALGLACAAAGAEAPIEFSGVLTNEGHVKIALTSTATHVTRWVEPGEDFLGYTVTRYDPKEDAVFLKRSGQEIRLGLIPSKSPNPAATTAAAATPANQAAATEVTANAVRSNLRQFVAAARRFQAERGTNSVAFSDVVGPGKYIRELTPVAGENYSALTFSPDVTSVSVTTSNGTNVALDTTTGASPAVGVSVANVPPTAPSAAASTATTTPATATTSAPASNTASTTAPVTLPPSLPATTPQPPSETNTVATTPPTTPSTPSTSSTASSTTIGATNALPASTIGTPPSTATGFPPPTTPNAGDALAPTGTRYTTRPGETLGDVARANGMTVEQLQALNPGLNAGSLPSGQVVRIR
jgi:LysM repeat protein